VFGTTIRVDLYAFAVAAFDSARSSSVTKVLPSFVHTSGRWIVTAILVCTEAFFVIEQTWPRSAELRLALQCLQKVLELRQSQIEALSDVAKVDDACANADPADIYGGAAGDLSAYLESGLTLDMCRTMTPSAAIARWRSYIERLSNVLVEAELPSASEACQAALRKVCARPRCSVLPLCTCEGDSLLSCVRLFRWSIQRPSHRAL
jgi:hypothetical protein